MSTIFERDLEFGQRKELVVQKVLEKGYGIVSHIDNKANTHDLILDSGCKIEVKADERISQTHNLLLELYSDGKTKSPGWLQYSESDVLAVCTDINDEYRYSTSVWFIDFKEMREYIKQKFFGGDFNKDDELALRQVKSINGRAINILIPVGMIAQFVISIYSKVEGIERKRKVSLKAFCENCVRAICLKPSRLY